MSMMCSVKFSGRKLLSTNDGVIDLGPESVSIDDCKIKVENVEVNNKTSRASVSFSGIGIVKTAVYEFPTDLNGSNNIFQAYIYLKTLPEFSGAVDC